MLQLGAVRKIAHVYIDDFFALVEQREQKSECPPLLVVKKHPQSKIESISPEARLLGIIPTMRRHQVLQRFPQIQCIQPDYEKYARMGDQISALFREYTEWVEMIAPFEAYLDITYNKVDIPFARRTAQLIHSDLRSQFGFKANIAVAPNKMLAKIASETQDKGVISEVHREEIDTFLCNKPISFLPHIGTKTRGRLTSAQIETIGQLARENKNSLRQLCGKHAVRLWDLARGFDDTPVSPTTKTLRLQISLPTPLYSLCEISDVLRPHAETLAGQLQRRNLRCRDLTLYIRSANGQISVVNTQLSHFSNQALTLANNAFTLIRESSLHESGIRCVDVELSNFTDKDIEQLDLFAH